MRPDRIPLFPLNVVLLPGADLPLHIFEPRYLEMVSRCLKEKSEFGVLLALPKGVARVGCTAEIIEVVHRNSDGTMDILTVGREPFRVIEFFEENPLIEGHVDYLEDRDSEPNTPMRRELVELYETCHTLIFEDYPKNTDPRVFRSTLVSHRRHPADGFALEAADSRIAHGNGPAGAPGRVSSRMGAASTEDRRHAPARRRQWTRIELACVGSPKLTGDAERKPMTATSSMQSSGHPRARTLGELKRIPDFDARTISRSVKNEMRQNLLRMIEKNEPLFPGVHGYEDTVIPQIINALLSRHNFILLGLRGQAKSRILRGLAQFLDAEIPVVAGCEINDDPLKPICRACREKVAAEGDGTPIAWMARDQRYVEKLATPDVTMADIIGDVDPIRAARGGRDLSDELTIHYGLLPRANRGIFAINELPDLAGKIQVGLFNIMQEGDIQIKGYPLRLPLDVLLVFTANPEDYTARGKIITPLKDRHRRRDSHALSFDS